ncbi:MAG: Fur family transcriptional regulator [Phocaeicola sp.]
MKTFNYLLSHSIKPSVQRIAIMDYLLANKTHPSVDEIYSNLSAKIPTLSRTTVYNTLKLFVEQGAALMLTIEEKNACFDGDISQHAHFLCKECGKIYDMHPESDSSREHVVTKDGFLIQETHHYYKGVCPHCAALESISLTN